MSLDTDGTLHFAAIPCRNCPPPSLQKTPRWAYVPLLEAISPVKFSVKYAEAPKYVFCFRPSSCKSKVIVFFCIFFCILLNCLPYLVNKNEYKTCHCLALETTLRQRACFPTPGPPVPALQCLQDREFCAIGKV